MYYEDLSNYKYYLKIPLANVHAVGWLDKDFPFSIGKTPDDFLPKLAEIILGNSHVDAQVNKIRSQHPCSLSDCCVKALEHNGKIDPLGMAEIWVPSKDNGKYFCAPSMIYHYIQVHRYSPPEPFIDAVMNFNLSLPFDAQAVYLNQIKGHF